MPWTSGPKIRLWVIGAFKRGYNFGSPFKLTLTSFKLYIRISLPRSQPTHVLRCQWAKSCAREQSKRNHKKKKKKKALGRNSLSLLQAAKEMATAEGIRNKNGTCLFTLSVLSKHCDNALRAARFSVLPPKIQSPSPIFTHYRRKPRRVKLLRREMSVQKVQKSPAWDFQTAELLFQIVQTPPGTVTLQLHNLS